jgi:hypothetical protein
MYFGTGLPRVHLYDNTGYAKLTVSLPRPQRRSDTPYVNEFAIEKNVNGDLIKVQNYFRYKDRWTFVNLDEIYVDRLIQVANWNEILRVRPYTAHLWEDVIVSDFICGSHAGNINYSDVEIEFTGVKRRDKIPRDPDYIYTLHGGMGNRQGIV